MNSRISNEVEERITRHVMGDLDPSWRVVHTKVALAAVLGGLVSLFICGQFGYGLTSIAEAFNHSIHERMGAIPCALVCGAMYAAFPVAILRFGLCPPLQFRAIVKRKWQAIVFWFACFGAAMARLGHHGDSFLTFAGWVIAAIFAANLVAQLFFVVLPLWETPLRVRLFDQR